MAMEQAAQFLQEMRTNEKIKESLENLSKITDEKQTYGLLADAAKNAGFDVNAEELEEAVKARQQELLRQTGEVSEGIQALSAEDLDQVAGGYWWAADDSPIDGHELFCIFAWHDSDWSKEHDDWCTKNYIFKDWYYRN